MSNTHSWPVGGDGNFGGHLQDDQFNELRNDDRFPQLQHYSGTACSKVANGVFGSAHILSEAIYYTFAIHAAYRYINGESFVGMNEQAPQLLNYALINGPALAAVLLPVIAKLAPVYGTWSNASIAENISRNKSHMKTDIFNVFVPAGITGFACYAFMQILVANGVHPKLANGVGISLMVLTIPAQLFGRVMANQLNRDYLIDTDGYNGSYAYLKRLRSTFHSDMWRYRSKLDTLGDGYSKYIQLAGGGLTGYFFADVLSDIFGDTFNSVGKQCAIKIPFVLVGLVGEIMSIVYAYRDDKVDRPHAAASKLVAGFMSVLSSLPAVLATARIAMQWDANELNYQYANLAVFIGAAAILTPGIARGHYREMIDVLDQTYSKLRCCAPRRGLFTSAETSCVDRLFACCRKHGGEQEALVYDGGNLPDQYTF